MTIEREPAGNYEDDSGRLSEKFAAKLAIARAGLKGLFDDRATLVEKPGKGNLTTIVIPGNGGNGERIAENLHPHFEEFGPLMVIAHPKKGFSIDSVGEQLLRAYDRANGNKKALLSLSMGLMVVNHLKIIPEVAEAIIDKDGGGTEFEITDSGVSGISNLLPYSRFLLDKVGRLSPKHVAAVAIDRIMGANDTMRHESIPQMHWMLHANHLQPGSIAHVGEHTQEKYYVSAALDYRVNCEESFLDQNILDDGRWQQRWHGLIGHAEGQNHPEIFTHIIKESVNKAKVG